MRQSPPQGGNRHVDHGAQYMSTSFDRAWHHVVILVSVVRLPLIIITFGPGCGRSAAVAATQLIESKARGDRLVNHDVHHLITSFDRALASYCVLCLGFSILIDFHRTTSTHVVVDYRLHSR